MHTHTRTHTHTHTHTRARTHTYIYTHAHTRIQTRTHTYTHIHARTHTHIHTHARAHTHTHIHARTHAHTHAHTHTHTESRRYRRLVQRNRFKEQDSIVHPCDASSDTGGERSLTRSAVGECGKCPHRRKNSQKQIVRLRTLELRSDNTSLTRTPGVMLVQTSGSGYC